MQQKNNTVLSNRITIKGNVLLYLKNNSELKAESGITVESDNTLNIYGSTDAETGKLIANGFNGDAAIGGVHGSDGRDYEKGHNGTVCGDLNMYGGIVTVFGSGDGVGFGGGFGGHGGLRGDGGNGGDGGTLNLYGGQFTVSGSEYRAIGGGKGGYGDDQHITTNPSWPGKSTTINIYGNPVIKAGENAGNVSDVTEYGDEKYFSVVYTPGDSGNSFPFIPSDNGDPDPRPFNPDSGEHTHFGILRHGMEATKSSAGYKDYYECSCGNFFEDEDCMVEINDLAKWKAEGGNGYLPRLKSNSDPIVISAKAAEANETNPETGAPVLNMSTGITVIVAAAFIFTDKKHK